MCLQMSAETARIALEIARKMENGNLSYRLKACVLRNREHGILMPKHVQLGGANVKVQ